MRSKIVMGIAAIMAVSMTAVPAVSAWGPEDRPAYTNESPADHAVFNSIKNNAKAGDEFDFVRVAEKSKDAVFGNDLEIEAGKQYEVWIYYHNDASSTYNDEAYGYKGVARDTRMSTSFPEELKTGERGEISGVITWKQSEMAVSPAASNPDEEEGDAEATVIDKVWDEAYVTAKEAVTLHYVIGSAKIYNGYGVNGSVMPMALFSKEGTFIGLDELNGIVLGCDEYSGQVVYTIQTEAAVTPTEVPKELPKTGPVEIALTVVVVLVVLAGVVYWSKTHKAVSKATKRAKGKK